MGLRVRGFVPAAHRGRPFALHPAPTAPLSAIPKMPLRAPTLLLPLDGFLSSCDLPPNGHWLHVVPRTHLPFRLFPPNTIWPRAAAGFRQQWARPKLTATVSAIA